MRFEDARSASGSVAMKITRRSSIQGPIVSEGGAPKGSGARATGNTGSADSVDVSGAARLRQRLRAEIGDVETVTTERVAALQERVGADDYHPPSREVAERLLTELASDALA
jgi:hypothetical protein